ncbi:MAG: heat-inducible transcriptional repressor HrcA [bacterium]
MLSDRKRQVLKAVVSEYVSTAEPVGSRTLVRRHKLGVSTATIRNEMADLEEMGFLEQPHVSAGRIPSDQGYRFYVDNLMSQDELTSSERELLNQLVKTKVQEVDTVLASASRMLSQISNYVGLVTSPRLISDRLSAVKLVHLEKQLSLLLLFTESGLMESRLLVVPPEIEPPDLEGLATYFTRKLVGKPLEEVTDQLLDRVYTELLDDFRQSRDLLAQITESVLSWLRPGSRGRVYLGGAHNILKQPEFHNLDKVRHLLVLLEEEPLLLQLLKRRPGITVTIGQENELPAMRECTVVSATYTVRGRSSGTVAVLGPTRMDYGHVMSILEYMACCLEEVFSGQD